MNTERITARDLRIVLVSLLIIVGCTIYTRLNFSRAFPEASIELLYSREQITKMARDFLAARGLATDGFRNLTLFDPDNTARIYLERELGLEEANRLMRGEVAVWRWRARWFRPPSQEERIVFLTPEGRLVGFQNVISEAAPGARLSQEEALQYATAFLNEQTTQPHRLIEQQRIERPNRLDYVFTWERENFRAAAATYRRSVVIQGDAVGGYQEQLYVPEQWRREFAGLRSRNDLFAQIATAFYVPLILSAVAVVILSLRRGAIAWRPVLAISAVVGILMVLNQWNALAFVIDRMPTSSPFQEMVALGLLQGVGSGVVAFFYVVLAAAAGEPLYRAQHPEKLSLASAFSAKGVATKEFFLATVTGYGFAAAHIAFVVAFYLIGRRFGVWSPQEVPYSDLLSTWLPWLYPLTISLLAATSEEFWFRLFAIPFLKRYLRFAWVAIVLPAFIWGFLHANYPQQPAWIRGVEVGVIGVAAGLLMVRFGILATLVWHYTVDAILIGMFLFQSDNLFFRLSGWFVAGAVFFPLLASLILYRRRGGFLADPEMLNRARQQPVPAAQPAQAAPSAQSALPPLRPVAGWPHRYLYAAGAIAFIAGLVFAPTRIGDFLEVKINRRQAEAAGALRLGQLGFDRREWRKVTEYFPNVRIAEYEYLRREVGPAEANRLLQQWTQPNLWRVWFFRPLEQEQRYFYVDQEGGIARADVVLPENARGAKLTTEQALNLAGIHLGWKGIDLDRYKLVDSQIEKRPNRTDHSFVWESLEFKVGEARARVSLQIKGYEPSNFQRYLYLPEAWVRDFERLRLQTLLFPAALGVLALMVLLLFIGRLSGRLQPQRPHRYCWKVYWGAALLTSGLAVLEMLNEWTLLFADYRTETPLVNYIASTVSGGLITVFLSGVGAFLGVMALDMFLQMTLRERLVLPPSLPAAAAIAALVWGLNRVLGYLGQLVPGPRYSDSLSLPAGLETFLPAFTVLNQAITRSIAAVVVAGVAACLLLRFVQGRLRTGLIASLIVLLAAGQPTIQQALFLAGISVVWLGAATLILRTAGSDVVAVAAGVFLLLGTIGSAAHIDQPNLWYRGNGIAALALVLLAGLALARLARGPASEEESPPEA
ncbi:MAG: CPBP family intramembrane metalloprotease [Bryobacteraceae bacterium]|nr:CPBP family intramembrane metalloprotease [Bryobacteraceae bacterium]